MKFRKYILFIPVFALALLSAYKEESYTKDELIGDFNPAHTSGFKRIRNRHTTKADAYLRSEVYDAFQQMFEAAKADGIDLVIISATRNKNYQSGIWNRKWNSFGGDENTRAERILQYSSMPGTSRHHWGTDFDLNSLNNSYFESGTGLQIYNWLTSNAAKYGFYQPYTAYNNYRDAGYREEKWHWSYFPTASKLQRAYTFMVDYHDLSGFDGSEYAQTLDVINNYVNGVEAWPGK